MHFFVFLSSSLGEAAEPGPRISDREIVERLTRIEKGQKALLRKMDKRFEEVDKRFESMEKLFDRLTNIFLGIVAAFAGVVAVTIGFAIWDRKTTLKPVMERVERIKIILKRFAGKEPRLAEVLRTLGLL